MKHMIWLIAFVLAVPSNVEAQAGTCNAVPGAPHNNKNGLKKYRVNTSLVSQFAGFDGDEALGSVMLGADQWNEAGNGGYFQYVGTTTATDIPNTASACAAANIDYSLVYFSTGCGASASAVARCGGDQFLITVRRNTDFCAGQWDFGNGAVSNTIDRDLPALFAHEFGHTQGIEHPTNGEAATMGGGTSPRTFRRHLYEWDFKCSASLTGKRDLNAYRKFQYSSGSFGSAVNFKSGVTKAHAGLASGITWAAAYHRRTAVAWDAGMNGTYTNLSNPSSTNGIGFIPGFWRETPSVDRVFYSYWDDYPTDYDWSSVHLIRQIRSTNDFASQTAGYLSYCLYPYGFMGCSGSTYVRSSGNLATAYLDMGSDERSIVAWLHQDRDDYTSTPANEIKISIGSVSDTTLGLGINTGIRSAVPPGVACENNFSGAYDCVLVYVPITDLELRIAARRFQVVLSGGTHYSTIFDANTYLFPSTSRASAPITVWYNAGQNMFYAAWRRAAANQPIGVRRSSTGTSWSFVSSNLDTSYTAPSAVSQSAGSTNYLVYTK